MFVSRLSTISALLAALSLTACASDPPIDDADASSSSPTGGGLPLGGDTPPSESDAALPPAGGAEPPADPAEVDAFWSELFGVICTQGATCCPNDPNFAPGGLCASFSGLIGNSSKEDVAGGYARFVPGATAGCVTAARALIEQAGCDADIISLLTQFFTIGECSAVFPPDQRQGEPCTKDVGQCLTGLVCATGPGGATCAPPIATGGDCTPAMANVGCAPTDVCSPATLKCITRVAEGGACAAPEECASGQCMSGQCGPVPSVGFCGNTAPPL